MLQAAFFSRLLDKPMGSNPFEPKIHEAFEYPCSDPSSILRSHPLLPHPGLHYVHDISNLSLDIKSNQ